MIGGMMNQQLDLFDVAPTALAPYWVPKTRDLPACDTCANYTPLNDRYGSGVGNCKSHGPVECWGYCAMHREGGDND
jgi:hypothetical protein